MVLLFFAAVLLFSSFKLLSAGDDEDEDDDLSQNFIVKTCKCAVPAFKLPWLLSESGSGPVSELAIITCHRDSVQFPLVEAMHANGTLTEDLLLWHRIQRLAVAHRLAVIPCRCVAHTW